MSDQTRPRILFFAHETTWSGAPIQLFHLVSWFREKGWAIGVATPKPHTSEAGPISAELERIGIEIFPVLDLSVQPDLVELATLCACFDVVIANTLVMLAPVGAAKENGIPVIWYIHETQVAQQLMVHIPEIHPQHRRADLLIMPTHRTAQLYSGLTPRPIEVVPYGIPWPRIPPVASPISQTSTQFLLLGTYEPRKGQDLYLNAIEQLETPTGSHPIFRMAGRILDRCFHEHLAAQAGQMTNVELHDALSHEDALKACAATDVLVCASRDETMPIAILEAMSLGKAIVTMSVGGVAEWLVDGRNALLIPPEDSRALAAALRRCLVEPDLLVSLGQNARHTFATNFSIERLGERFV